MKWLWLLLIPWLVALGIAVQPSSHRAPHLAHVRALDRPDTTLPTLSP